MLNIQKMGQKFWTDVVILFFRGLATFLGDFIFRKQKTIFSCLYIFLATKKKLCFADVCQIFSVWVNELFRIIFV